MIENLCCVVCVFGNANADNIKLHRKINIRRSSIRYADYFSMLYVF